MGVLRKRPPHYCLRMMAYHERVACAPLNMCLQMITRQPSKRRPGSLPSFYASQWALLWATSLVGLKEAVPNVVIDIKPPVTSDAGNGRERHEAVQEVVSTLGLWGKVGGQRHWLFAHCSHQGGCLPTVAIKVAVCPL